MELRFSAAEIVAIVQPVRVAGSTSESLRGIAALDRAGPGDLSFLANPKYRALVAGCRASLLLLPADYPGEPPAGQQWLFLENPSHGLTLLCRRLEEMLRPRPAAGRHPTALVDPTARVPESASLGPYTVVEAGAELGERTVVEAHGFVGRGARTGPDCWLMSRVYLGAGCVLGARVRLQPGVVIGSDGYGYDTVAGRHEKVPQLGIVVLGDDVEVGANSTIDRARFDRTVVGEGTKIDNLVQIGHNVVIGRHCLLVAQVGIAGSTVIGDHVVLGGQVGVAGHLEIGSGAQIGGQAGVTRDVPPKSFLWGTPAIAHLQEQKFALLRHRLPELLRRVDRLEERIGGTEKPSP